jgi:hypothetical protein
MKYFTYKTGDTFDVFAALTESPNSRGEYFGVKVRDYTCAFIPYYDLQETDAGGSDLLLISFAIDKSRAKLTKLRAQRNKITGK